MCLRYDLTRTAFALPAACCIANSNVIQFRAKHHQILQPARLPRCPCFTDPSDLRGKSSLFLRAVNKNNNVTSQVNGCLQRNRVDDLLLVVRRTMQAAISLAISLLVYTRGGFAEDLTIAFPASKDPELRKVQQTMVQAWGYVGAYYMDPTYNGLDWQKVLQDSLAATFKAPDPTAAYKEIEAMLSKLDDPYTRIFPPNEAASPVRMLTGEVVALGLAVEWDDTGDAATVAFVADGSPAARAGIAVGDKLLEVNGVAIRDIKQQDVDGLLIREAELKLRPQGALLSDITIKLQPEAIEVHPVQYAALSRKDGGTTGYVRITTFSENASREVEDAVRELLSAGASEFILDLRDNGGGLLQSGLDIGALWLPRGDVYAHISGHSGEEFTVTVDEDRQLPLGPLVVLVNGGSASASEMLAAALHEDRGAVLVGENTFGKGVTQEGVPLMDGSLLMLSNTKYRTPQHNEVDKVGMRPDIECKPDVVEYGYVVSDEQQQDVLQDDPCVQLAQEKLKSVTLSRST